MYFSTENENQDLFGLEPITLQECIVKLRKHKIMSVDCETQGLSPIDNILLMLQISTPVEDYVIDCRGLDLTPLNEIFGSKDYLKLFHNVAFDYKFLKAAGVTTENVYCTMLMSKVISCGKSHLGHTLKEVLHRLLEIEMDKEARSSFIGMVDQTFTKEQVVYGIKDTQHLITIRDKQLPQIEKHGLKNVARLENEVVLAFGDISLNGMFLDQDKWEDKAEIAKKELDKLLPQLDTLLVSTYPKYATPQTALFEGRPTELNWNSPKQVLEVFRMIHPELESVGAPVLQPYYDPIIKLYKTYKESNKSYNTYGIGYYKYLHSDDKVHTGFNQVLQTGRVSSSSPNMQQMPGDYRECFVPEKKDWVYVSADYASQELAVIAYGAKEEVWLEAIRNGDDLHSICAALVFKDKWSSALPDSPERKALRQSVKMVSFGLAYGMSSYGLSSRLEIPENEAKLIITQYFAAFPKIKGFLDNLGQFGKYNGFIRTYSPYRRIRWFPEWKGNRTDNMGKIIRASKNSPIQGSASDMTKSALIFLRNLVKELPYEVEIVAQIHDELACVCHKDNAEDLAQVLKKAMEDAADIILEKGLLKAEPTITPYWSK